MAVTHEEFMDLASAIVKASVDKLREQFESGMEEPDMSEITSVPALFEVMWVSTQPDAVIEVVDILPLMTNVPGCEKFATCMTFKYLRNGPELIFGWTVGHGPVEHPSRQDGWAEFTDGLDDVITTFLIDAGFPIEVVQNTIPPSRQRHRADRMQTALRKQLTEEQEKLIAEARAEMDSKLNSLFEGG